MIVFHPDAIVAAKANLGPASRACGSPLRDGDEAIILMYMIFLVLRVPHGVEDMASVLLAICPHEEGNASIRACGSSIDIFEPASCGLHV